MSWFSFFTKSSKDDKPERSTITNNDNNNNNSNSSISDGGVVKEGSSSSSSASSGVDSQKQQQQHGDKSSNTSKVDVKKSGNGNVTVYGHRVSKAEGQICVDCEGGDSNAGSSISNNSNVGKNSELQETKLEVSNRNSSSNINGSGNSSGEKMESTINYDAQKMVGHGAFGAVFMSVVVETGETVAIKKVLQDKRFKNRELQVMKQLQANPHPYVCSLINSFVSKGTKQGEIYLNLVLEYVPETMYSQIKYYNRLREPFPEFLIQMYTYQLARAIAHIHGLGICHRDIKPQNLLLDPANARLKLCDFGSAKQLIEGEPNIAYICSRFYRAPELIFGSTTYSVAVDVWSMGCVFAEMLIGLPIFPGQSSADQLVEVIKVLGAPSKEQLKEMNPNYQEFKFPAIKAQSFNSLFRTGTSETAISLASQLFRYEPKKRPRAIQVCEHSYFDILRNPSIGSSPPFIKFMKNAKPDYKYRAIRISNESAMERDRNSSSTFVSSTVSETARLDTLPVEMFIFTPEELSFHKESGVSSGGNNLVPSAVAELYPELSPRTSDKRDKNASANTGGAHLSPVSGNNSSNSSSNSNSSSDDRKSSKEAVASDSSVIVTETSTGDSIYLSIVNSSSNAAMTDNIATGTVVSVGNDDDRKNEKNAISSSGDLNSNSSNSNSNSNNNSDDNRVDTKNVNSASALPSEPLNSPQGRSADT